MNYYDEEIKIDGSEATNIKLDQSENASTSKSSRSSTMTTPSRQPIRPNKKPEGILHSSMINPDEEDEQMEGMVKDLDDSDVSESESLDSTDFPDNRDQKVRLIRPSNWENLMVPQDIKDMFPFILKYTPQVTEPEYRLQPFIPEYVPAVGDVDAFLKVSLPKVLDKRREQAVQSHVQKLGLNLLDEPSGQQSEPSLLSVKLGSVLTGSAKSLSAGPVAKAPKDIDKWINEVEKIQLGHNSFGMQPEKDIDGMLINWPESYTAVKNDLKLAFENKNLTLVEYIGIICEKLEIPCPPSTEITQAECIQKVFTLFSLYLVVNNLYD